MKQSKTAETPLEIKIYHTLPDAAREIRVTVFVEEQGFVEEFDSTDNDAVHFVTYDGDRAVATCRLFRTTEDDSYTLGRLAVRKEYRGRHLGTALIKAAEDYVRSVMGSALILHAQCAAQTFYEKSGFSAYGGIEYEQDCPHVWMKKELR